MSGARQPRITVFGAGAVGCFVGGAWLAAGLDVRFVGRASVEDMLRRDDLVLSDHTGWSARVASAAVHFDTHPTHLHEADLIVLTVKCTGLDLAARDIARHARPEAPVISLLNGVRPVPMLKRLLPGRRIIAGMVPFNVTSPAPGHWHQGTKGNVTLEGTRETQALSQRLAGSHSPVDLRDDMAAVAWGKLLLNLNNPVNALSGLTLRQQLSQRGYRRVLAASIREALQLLKTAGIEPAKVAALPAALLPAMLEKPDWLFNTVGLPLQKIDSHARSSMAEDLARGRGTEIDFLNGEILLLAERLGVRAPVNEAIVTLIRAAEKGGTSPVLPAHVLEAKVASLSGQDDLQRG